MKKNTVFFLAAIIGTMTALDFMRFANAKEQYQNLFLFLDTWREPLKQEWIEIESSKIAFLKAYNNQEEESGQMPLLKEKIGGRNYCYFEPEDKTEISFLAYKSLKERIERYEERKELVKERENKTANLKAFLFDANGNYCHWAYRLSIN